jgi:GrpB-like predicted nucleotidyltransferase (UPF0157 family)
LVYLFFRVLLLCMELSNYDPRWVKDFEKEKIEIQRLFGVKMLAIEHIGSTAIPGLLSKPIIDIAVMIQNHEDADSFTSRLGIIGYMFNSKSTERHFYQKGQPIKFHLSVAYAERDGFWIRQVMFRDYLRSHPASLAEYADLKKKLIADFPEGKGDYSYGKTEFVNRILALAGWKEGRLFSDVITIH